LQVLFQGGEALKVVTTHAEGSKVVLILK